MKRFMEFFEDEQGALSSNRLIFIIGMIWLMGICTIAIKQDVSLMDTGIFFVTVSTILSTFKAIQKGQEKSK